MLRELLTWLAAAPSATGRRLGYLRHSVALEARHRRRRKAWAPHIARCHATIEAAIAATPRRRLAVVYGSGLLAELPMEALVGGFDRVVLIDVAHLPAARWRVRRFRNVELMVADITGVAAPLAAGGPELPAPQPPPFAADPGADLIVSANLLSQLPLVPTEFATAKGRYDEVALADFARSIVSGHLAALRSSPARVCLITDVRSEYRDRAGTVIETDDVLWGVALPPLRPERHAEWSWSLAPFGEEDRRYEIVNRVVGIPDLTAAVEVE